MYEESDLNSSPRMEAEVFCKKNTLPLFISLSHFANNIFKYFRYRKPLNSSKDADEKC